MTTSHNPAPIVRPATCIDVRDLLTYMQSRWLSMELNGSSWSTPQEALTAAFDKSPESFAIEKDGCLAAVFGVVNLPDSNGSFWLFGTDALDSHSGGLSECLDLIRDFTDGHPCKALHSAVDAGHESVVAELKQLGFIFDGTVTSRDETSFLHFYRGTWSRLAA